MIRTGYPFRKFGFFYLAALLVHAFSQDLSSRGCVLTFNEFPYEPTGECIGHQEKLNVLGGISTTLCCQNVLNVLTKNLALHAANTSGAIFLPQNQWMNCSGKFLRQNDVSPFLCGFDNLYNGSSVCSSFSLASIQQDPVYKITLDACSNFNTSFDDACNNCTKAIFDALNSQLHHLGVSDDDPQIPICIVAVVISVAAGKLQNHSSVDDFYNCLLALDEYDDGYYKLKHSVVKGVMAAFIALIVLLLVLFLVKHVTSNKNKNKSKPPKPLPLKEIARWSGLYRFTKEEIENAINYDSDRKSLGRGSAGHVYKGVLPSGQVVAIKHIHKGNSSDSFQREVEGLSRVRHPNLVCLFGCCIDGADRYLVYEYCSAGNLAQHLLRKDTVLTWERRVKILRDCANGLKYLHHHIDGCIVHRDIKLTNILLIDNLDPKLSDFGLAKMLGLEESKVFTDVRGTIGYMDPEYMSNAKLTCASDIYSFGIVALQLLSGQKVIDFDLDARDQLTRKAKDVSSGKRPVSDFEDPRLNGKVNRADFEAILQIAVLCVAKSSKGRPTIDVVFEEMEKAWKNTANEMRSWREFSSSATPMSRSMEVVNAKEIKL